MFKLDAQLQNHTLPSDSEYNVNDALLAVHGQSQKSDLSASELHASIDYLDKIIQVSQNHNVSLPPNVGLPNRIIRNIFNNVVYCTVKLSVAHFS